MKKLFFLTFMILNFAQAGEVLIYSTLKQVPAIKNIEPKCQEVFTKNELKNIKFSFESLLKCPDSEDLFVRLKPLKVKIENRSILSFQSEPYEKFQWGLKNKG